MKVYIGGRQGSAAANGIRIDGAFGNVGIGIAAPVQRLDVNGQARIRGAVTINGTISGNLDSTNPAASGVLQVDCLSTPGSCYARYAP